MSDKVLILHGGLSSIPGLELDDIRRIPRGNSFQPDDSDLLCDLLWSDPMQVSTICLSFLKLFRFLGIPIFRLYFWVFLYSDYGFGYSFIQIMFMVILYSDNVYG